MNESPGREPATDDVIKRPTNLLTGVVLPVILLIAVLIVVMMTDMSRLFAVCDHYTAIQLVYPLIFGALGATLGGSIKLTGPLALFGGKWDGIVAGGIAAALLGFGITAWIKPQSCAPRQELVLQDFVTRKQIETTDGGGKIVVREYIAKIDWTDTQVQLGVDRSGDSFRDLKLLFTGNDKFRISLDFYRKADAASSYQPAASCPFEVKIGRPAQKKDQRRFQLVASNARNEIQVNPQLFTQLEERLKKGPTNLIVECLIGQSRLDGQESIDVATITGPLYVATPTGWPMGIFRPLELWFVSDAPKVEETKTTARGPEATEGESAPPVPAPPPQSAEPSLQPKRIVAGCNPNETFRSEVDRFLAGDDLDQSRRMALYANWKDVHCYVWALVRRNDNDTSSAARSRALRLTVNAIFNDSSDQPGYWQPQGENKRDFSKDLPYLASSDYRTIFELAQVDDLLLRGEAIRAIRSLPVDKFEVLFRSARDALESLSAAKQERLAIAAAFMYYNRIVEWLDEDPVAKPSTAIVTTDFTAAKRWIARNLLGKSTNAYDAMLFYAKGIVEKERQLTPDRGQSTFVAMTKAVEGMEDGYPSNFRHIAQGLALARGGADTQSILSLIKQVDVYPPATPLPANPPIAPQQVIYVGPGEQFSKQTVTIDKANARLLLRKGDWYLANGSGWVGWLRRPPKT